MRAKLLGHHLHPMLIVLPLGLFIMAVVFELLFFATHNPGLATVAYWDVGAGILTGLLAAATGLVDYTDIPKNTRAQGMAITHGIGNVFVMVLFIVSFFLRSDMPGHQPGALTMFLDLVAIGIGGVTAWMGGELVERLGVGVDRGANVNAPSSLGDEPADANVSGRRAMPRYTERPVEP